MTRRHYTRLGAVVSLVALLAAGCAADRYQPGGADAGPRGATGSLNTNESNPASTHPDRMQPAARGDNPNLPNPVTPQAVNESAPQPQGSFRDPTNAPGR
ncbi:MAG TPA: hypothetical protein VED01_14065 [Burkholderiales bacterium]|nr:hypothetical protein [Burkholderiales bacterium]